MIAKSDTASQTPCSAGHKAILNAAVKLFSERGFDAVSVRELATIAGVSKANIYHHFGSKRGVYIAVLRDTLNQTSMLLDTFWAGNESFKCRLAQFAQQHLQHILNNELSIRLLLREGLKDPQSNGKELAEEVVGQNFHRLTHLIRSGQESGELRQELDPAICAILLVGSHFFFFQSHNVVRHFPEGGFANKPDEYGREVLDILLNGMSSSDKADLS